MSHLRGSSSLKKSATTLLGMCSDEDSPVTHTHVNSYMCFILCPLTMMVSVYIGNFQG